MGSIKLKSLTLRNFKGIKHLVVNLSDINNIKGENGTGKTTIFDAATWLLFDKDSKERQSFEIKTLDCNNEVIHGLEHEVSGIITVDGKEISLSKILKEKWTKKKGEAQKQFTGHETLYCVNEVHVKQSEYKETINGIIDEQLFKLISSPLYFSTGLKWQDRRKVILEIIGDISLDRIVNHKAELKPLLMLLKDRNIEEYKKYIAARKKKLNNEIKAIPYRIDEINNSLVSVDEYDFSELEKEAREQEAYLQEIEEKIHQGYKLSEETLKERNRLYELKEKLIEIEFKAKNAAKAPLEYLYAALSKAERELAEEDSFINKIKYVLKSKEEEVLDLENELQLMKEKWHEVNEEILEILEENFICPTCKRALEAGDIEAKREEMLVNFNRNRMKKLEDIRIKGNSKIEYLKALRLEVINCKEELQKLIFDRNKLVASISKLQLDIKEFKSEINLKDNDEYRRVLKQCEELQALLSQPKETGQEVNSLKVKKNLLTQKLQEYSKKLAVKEQNERLKARMAKLLEEERCLAQDIGELEKQEFLCEEYIKTKVELLENNINKRFNFVTFKLFNTLINGAVEECCEALINGVPFSNANTASQINAGLDIINALCEHYGVDAPIFIDNRESVNEIMDCRAQIINLIVSKDKKLIVENDDLKRSNEDWMNVDDGELKEVDDDKMDFHDCENQNVNHDWEKIEVYGAKDADDWLKPEVSQSKTTVDNLRNFEVNKSKNIKDDWMNF